MAAGGSPSRWSLARRATHSEVFRLASPPEGGGVPAAPPSRPLRSLVEGGGGVGPARATRAEVALSRELLASSGERGASPGVAALAETFGHARVRRRLRDGVFEDGVDDENADDVGGANLVDLDDDSEEDDDDGDDDGDLSGDDVPGSPRAVYRYSGRSGAPGDVDDGGFVVPRRWAAVAGVRRSDSPGSGAASSSSSSSAGGGYGLHGSFAGGDVRGAFDTPPRLRIQSSARTRQFSVAAAGRAGLDGEAAPQRRASSAGGPRARGGGGGAEIVARRAVASSHEALYGGSSGAGTTAPAVAVPLQRGSGVVDGGVAPLWAYQRRERDDTLGGALLAVVAALARTRIGRVVVAILDRLYRVADTAGENRFVRALLALLATLWTLTKRMLAWLA